MKSTCTKKTPNTPALRRKPIEIPASESSAWSHPRSRKNRSWRFGNSGYLACKYAVTTSQPSPFLRGSDLQFMMQNMMQTNKQTEQKVLFFLRGFHQPKAKFDFLADGSVWDLHGYLYNNHKDIKWKHDNQRLSINQPGLSDNTARIDWSVSSKPPAAPPAWSLILSKMGQKKVIRKQGRHQ